MDLGLVISFGILLTYLNFLIHDAAIFSFLRIRLEKWMDLQVVRGKFVGKWIKKLYSCNLCNNFWISLIICMFSGFPFYLSLTSPIVAYIIYIKWMKQK